jgi:hypothetical protein
MNDTDSRDAATERAARHYAALLRLYSAEHRQMFGDQMLQTFRDQYRDAYAHRETGLWFWLAIIGDEMRSIAGERAISRRAKNDCTALRVIAMIVVGNILIFPQGIVPLLLQWSGSDAHSWFIARYLPAEWQIPVSIVSVVLGLAEWYAVWSLARRYRVDTDPEAAQ